ncbi:MAG: MaoC/PaaZ C-terminal domain-containing protein [Pseudomonadota bacterium]
MILSSGRYGWDDVRVGDWLVTERREVTAATIDAFADLSGDHFAIHMDDAAARDLGFSGRVAHGLLVLSMVDGLKNAAPAQFRAVASLGWTWSFCQPVHIGDRIGARIDVVGKRKVRTPGRGILQLGFKVTRAGGETVQTGENLLMVLR